jgi:hypothetical protein
MESELDQARSIAERIARRVSQDLHNTPNQGDASADLNSELAAMRAGLGDLQRRLNQIESKVRSEAIAASGQATVESSPMTLRTYSPWLAGVNASTAHPSQERFGVEEATVSELVDFFQNEKQCSIEPGGKPCDHCAMCSSRGF